MVLLPSVRLSLQTCAPSPIPSYCVCIALCLLSLSLSLTHTHTQFLFPFFWTLFCVINFHFLLLVFETYTNIIIMYLLENLYIIMLSCRHEVRILDMLRRGTL